MLTHIKPGFLLYIWGKSADSPHHPKELKKLSLKKQQPNNQIADEAEDMAQFMVGCLPGMHKAHINQVWWHTYNPSTKEVDRRIKNSRSSVTCLRAVWDKWASLKNKNKKPGTGECLLCCERTPEPRKHCGIHPKAAWTAPTWAQRIPSAPLLTSA